MHRSSASTLSDLVAVRGKTLRRRTVLLGLLGCLLVSACGKKGPLYLPPPDEQKDAKPAPKK